MLSISRVGLNESATFGRICLRAYCTVARNVYYDRLRDTCRSWQPQVSKKKAIISKYNTFEKFISALSSYLDTPHDATYKALCRLLNSWEHRYGSILTNVDEQLNIKSRVLKLASEGRPAHEVELIAVNIASKACSILGTMKYHEFSSVHVKMMKRINKWANAKQNNVKVGMRIISDLNSRHASSPVTAKTMPQERNAGAI